VASIFALPVQNASLDAVTNLFAPCAEEEFLRVLKPNGHLLLVGAGERHLMGLK
jgi:23S rRNA (guanine745-N1)-methyltransferase